VVDSVTLATYARPEGDNVNLEEAMPRTHPSSRRRRRWVVPTLLAVTVLAGVLVARELTPPQPPAYDGDAPEPAADGYVQARHSVLIAAPPDAVWAWANDPGLDLADVVDFDGGFPAVTATHPLIGDWVPGRREGDRRRVGFADGHYLAEQVLVDTPETFRYMIWGFTSPQRFVVRHGVAEFSYEAEGDGTRLTWTYSLLPTLPILRPAVQGFVDGTMSPMMRGTLAGMRDGAEATAAAG
jgi:hypothetical protein